MDKGESGIQGLSSFCAKCSLVCQMHNAHVLVKELGLIPRASFCGGEGLRVSGQLDLQEGNNADICTS